MAIAAACLPGAGSANISHEQVTLSTTLQRPIYPGSAEPVIFHATNQTTSAAYVSSVQLDRVRADRAHSRCNTTDFSMANVREDARVPANAGAYRLPNAGTFLFRNSRVNQDACAGARLTLVVSIN